MFANIPKDDDPFSSPLTNTAGRIDPSPASTNTTDDQLVDLFTSPTPDNGNSDGVDLTSAKIHVSLLGDLDPCSAPPTDNAGNLGSFNNVDPLAVIRHRFADRIDNADPFLSSTNKSTRSGDGLFAKLDPFSLPPSDDNQNDPFSVESEPVNVKLFLNVTGY